MDLTPSNAHNFDTKTQTPPPPTQHTNGSLKRRHHPTTTLPPSTVVSYKECLKNHAASIGGHALDGCGEFMPSTEPSSLTCAACGCHRNFHRRDRQEFSNPNFISFYHSPPSLSPSPSPSLSPSLSPPSYPRHMLAPPHVLLALGNAYSNERHVSFGSKTENPSGKKRHRTKFSQEQKEKMHEFSEKLGWKMQKGDEGMVQEFCNGIGVSREVFRVWMHNNKNTFKKRSSEMGNNQPDEKINGDRNGNCDGGGGFHSDNSNPHSTNNSNDDIHGN